MKYNINAETIYTLPDFFQLISAIHTQFSHELRVRSVIFLRFLKKQTQNITIISLDLLRSIIDFEIFVAPPRLLSGQNRRIQTHQRNLTAAPCFLSAEQPWAASQSCCSNNPSISAASPRLHRALKNISLIFKNTQNSLL